MRKGKGGVEADDPAEKVDGRRVVKAWACHAKTFRSPPTDDNKPKVLGRNSAF